MNALQNDMISKDLYKEEEKEEQSKINNVNPSYGQT